MTLVVDAPAGGGVRGLLVPDTHHQGGEQARRGDGEGPGDKEQDVRPHAARSPGRQQRHDHKQPARDDQALGGRRVAVDHLVVDVVAERVGQREQQAVGGGEVGEGLMHKFSYK